MSVINLKKENKFNKKSGLLIGIQYINHSDTRGATMLG